jgi:hypothetical protein
METGSLIGPLTTTFTPLGGTCTSLTAAITFTPPNLFMNVGAAGLSELGLGIGTLEAFGQIQEAYRESMA